MKKANRRRKSEYRILLAAIVLAIVILAGTTFAWLTSKDEVTNKLSANQNYNVAIVEDFKSPTTWVPGQKVNKDVSVVNTGNIDAFVKISLENDLASLIVEGDPVLMADADFTTKGIEISKTEVVALMAGSHMLLRAGTPVDIAVTVDTSDIENTINTVLSSSPADGLYIFSKTINEDISYTGFYIESGVYYAVQVTKKTTGYEAKARQLKTISSPTMTVNYDNAKTTAEQPYVKATYADLIIYIYLDKAELANWTLIDKTFYYNKTLASGTATGNLITAVALDENVSDEAYVEFDYDLSVCLDSIQTVPGTTKEEIIKPLNGSSTWAGIDSVVLGSPNADGKVTSLSSITWSE